MRFEAYFSWRSTGDCAVAARIRPQSGEHTFATMAIPAWSLKGLRGRKREETVEKIASEGCEWVETVFAGLPEPTAFATLSPSDVARLCVSTAWRPSALADGVPLIHDAGAFVAHWEALRRGRRRDPSLVRQDLDAALRLMHPIDRRALDAVYALSYSTEEPRDWLVAKAFADPGILRPGTA